MSFQVQNNQATTNPNENNSENAPMKVSTEQIKHLYKLTQFTIVPVQSKPRR